MVNVTYNDITCDLEIKEKQTETTLKSLLKKTFNKKDSKKELKIIKTSEPIHQLHEKSNATITISFEKKLTQKQEEFSKKIKEDVKMLRKSFNSRKTKKIQWRLDQLKQMKKLIQENTKLLKEALKGDLKQVAFVSEIVLVLSTVTEIEIAIANLKNWMKPEKLHLPIVQQPGWVMLEPEPKGVALIISPWNYPLLLTLKPLIGAIAAGNCCILKPSEITPKCSALLNKLITKYLDNDCIKVIEGAVWESKVVLEEKFDHIFYTGSGNVGKIIMKAAANHLTPVTLELGGKSPCIVSKNSNLVLAAKRIVWGKFLNSGQTCVAPDYLFVEESIKDKFLNLLKKTTEDFYSKNPQKSEEYSRMINSRHTKRIINLLPKDKKKIFYGGEYDSSDKYIGPTIVVDIDENHALMKDEIFGPILPVFTFKDLSETISFINKREKPLALYLFSTSSSEIKQVKEQTSSGALSINETLMHFLVPTIPFGGVGASGMGTYNGKYTFDLFSHKKPVVYKYTFVDVPMRYPPFSQSDFSILRFLTDPMKAIGNLKLLALAPIIYYVGKYGLEYWKNA